jgi:hypothetical protein
VPLSPVLRSRLTRTTQIEALPATKRHMSPSAASASGLSCSRGDNRAVSDGLPDLGDAYVFVRTGFFLAEHNYRITRRFVGALAAGRAGGLHVMFLPEDEPGSLSPFALAKINDAVEREGELIRREAAAHQCSRLGGERVW